MESWNPRNIYYYYDKPVPYHANSIKPEERNEKNQLLFYPARMSDYIMFNHYGSSLLLEKNTDQTLSFEDKIKYISMSYFQYIFFETLNNPDSKPYLFLFDRLLSIVLRDDSFKDFESSMNRYFHNDDNVYFKINDIIYDTDDFDNIRKIICEANLLEIPDEKISKELREKIREAEEFQAKMNKTKMGSLEVQMVCVQISTGMKLEDIYNLPIRKFIKILERVDKKLHYEIYMSASMSGMVEFKDKSILKHWMSDTSKEFFDNDAVIDYEKFKTEKGLK
jgi:hypothetical protein